MELRLALLVAVLGFQTAVAEEPEHVRKPEFLSVMIGGHSGPSYEVVYDQRTLRYYAARNFFELKSAKPVVLKPTDRQWQSLFEELENMQAWKWDRHYTDPRVHDGTYWRAYLIYPTRETRDLISSGSNAYPPNFDRFLIAVRKLIGEKPFK